MVKKGIILTVFHTTSFLWGTFNPHIEMGWSRQKKKIYIQQWDTNHFSMSAGQKRIPFPDQVLDVANETKVS